MRSDKVSEELWAEVHDVEQKAVIKTIPKKKKCKKAKWLSKEAVQKLRKEEKLKAKEKRKKYTHLNPECQRTARRYRKAFLSDQCKEIEENSKMGKTETSSRK